MRARCRETLHQPALPVWSRTRRLAGYPRASRVSTPSRSRGLFTPSAPRSSTWRYVLVRTSPVAEQVLRRTNVMPSFEHMRCETVPPMLPSTWAPHDGDAPAPGRRRLDTIQSWLGHASVNTTHHYVEADLEMKRRALTQPIAVRRRLGSFGEPAGIRGERVEGASGDRIPAPYRHRGADVYCYHALSSQPIPGISARVARRAKDQ